MYNAEVQMEEISLGEDMEVLVLKGKGDSIISRTGELFYSTEKTRYFRICNLVS
jgi:hypothetical protein